MANYINKSFSGVCPVTNEQATINIEFVTIDALSHIKGHFTCPNQNCPNSNECPLYNNAPMEC